MSRKKKDPIYHELERITNKELKLFQKRSRNLNTYLLEHYHYFSEQRKRVFDLLKDAIRKNCNAYEFKNFQRATSYKYCLNPLSARGSVISVTGGRFNFGNISPNLPKFPALYVAKDKETAIKEAFQVGELGQNNGLSNNDLALINQRSMCVVTVDGYLELVLNLNVKENLKDFFQEISHIKLPKSLLNKAKKFNINPCPEIKTLNALYDTIFANDYGRHSFLFDLPSNSQILGQIAFESGIQAIQYPSKFTGMDCLAIYPENFEFSDSSIELNSDEMPGSIVDSAQRMNKDSYRNFL